jgi:glycosyltransferase involved in cell wall biosynthesis
LSADRLLSVIPGPVFGGAHNQLIRLAPGLADAGIETVALLPEDADEAASRIEAAGIEVIRAPISRLRGTAGALTAARSLAALPPEVRRLRRLIAAERADLVQVHGAINVAPGIAARLERPAIVWQILDTRAPPALRRLTMPLVTRAADAITSWGRRLASAHPGAERFGERLVIVYPPIDPALGPDPALASTARERLGVDPGTPLVGTLGVRQPQKGHELFVRAAADVRRTHPDAQFRVLGAASPSHAAQMEAVEGEARELGLDSALDFVDPGPRPTDLLQALDLFALTSWPNSEGMPTAILEAMACAKPVVTVDVGAVRELVSDGETGLVVPPEDATALAAQIVRLLDDPDLARRMGEAGRARAEREFGLGELVERHLRAYRLALDHRRRR